MTITELDEICAELARLCYQLASLKKDTADRLDVRTAEIIETIRGISPHQLRHFEQERDHGIMYAEPLDIEL